MRLIYLYSLALLILICDQVAKKYMSGLLPLCEPGMCESIELLSFFKLTVLHNAGAAFSFLNDAGGWQRWFLVFVSTAVSGVIAWWMAQIYSTQRLQAVALSIILGGAMGNLVDRVLNGYVVDYLVFYYKSYYFPAFNVADAAITVGAALLILEMFMTREKSDES